MRYSYSKRPRKKLMGEINVVPYIDVMLVLLVIFMVTTPLLTEGVKIELPRAEAKPVLNPDAEPFVVDVNASGEYFINDDASTPVTLQRMYAMAAAVLRRQPKTPFLVRGDRRVEYGAIVQAMVSLQKAGVPSIGLVTDPNAK
ncbi:MAG TPA: protein TolR [Gammaproteobacteria bacterium]|nr:protein TolR [Gammaproteobacteria bacterium]